MAQVELRESRKHQRDDPMVGIWLRAVLDRKHPRKQVLHANPQHQNNV